jgi:ABC-type sulfate transport system substrate-binding protein
MTLILSAYCFHNKTRGLTVADVADPKYGAWLGQLERSVSGLSNSTGNIMREMVLKGPSTYDAVLVYEATAIDYLKNAENRWEPLQVVYPDRNLWSDHPYYILGSDWVSADQRRAAEAFLEFLMSEPVQQRAIDHGFRPGNTSVGVRYSQSPFLLYENQGLKIELQTVCEPPAPDVINNLERLWQRVGRPN